jgi:hypothetical protein
MKPNQVAAALEMYIDLQQPVMLTGEAGIYKSSIVQQVTTKMGRQLIDVRGALLDPVDLRGLPHVNGDGRAHWAVPDFLPRDGEGVLFFDEVNRAPQMVQNAILQLTLDRKLGEYTLPDGWTVVAAGNPDTSRGVTRMGEALSSRFVHIECEVDLDDWVAWASANGIRPEVVAFVKFRPNLLHAYDPKSTDKSFPCPRSWAFVSKALAKGPRDDIEHACYAGTVGAGAAAEFMFFMHTFRTLPSLDGILKNPKAAAVPDEPGTMYAIGAGLANKATKANFDNFMTYVERMPAEWMIFAVKTATKRDPLLCESRRFIDFAAKHQDLMG